MGSAVVLREADLAAEEVALLVVNRADGVVLRVVDLAGRLAAVGLLGRQALAEIVAGATVVHAVASIHPASSHD